MVPRDLLADYERAQTVAFSWAHTASLTGNRRHLETSLACSKIARERLEVLLRERPDLATARRLEALRQKLEHEALADRSMDLVRSARALLRRLDEAAADTPAKAPAETVAAG